ncbi:MAG TPA: DUF6128 domain-containing protein [Lachnospiraceae bacterium]|nr:DUF6128 domain-containing protein [Lachnospiraceae bacterium]
MSFYTKTISYIDYYENSIKSKNIGHVKAEVRDDNCKLLINVRGLKITDNVTVKVSILQNDNSGGFVNRQLATLELEGGKGEKTLSLPASSIAGIPFHEIKGFHFAISSNRYGIAMLKDGEVNYIHPKNEVMMQERVDSLQDQMEPINNVSESKNKISELKHNISELKNNVSESKNNVMESMNSISESKNNIMESMNNEQDENKLRKMKNSWENHNMRYHSNHLCDDKWQQLCKMFPIIHPLKNEKDYLSISPKDFVIFSKEYQKLVHNSFLLHGFYNYQHIILGRYDEIYYLGVPGTYHEREAIVANMFGFEGFESVEEQETGGFGYYMTKVNI